jgi:HK97 gp10 family phage protein
MKDLDRQLKTFGQRVYKNVMRQAVRAGGMVIVKAAKAKAPTESGQTKKSFGLKIKTYISHLAVVAIIGARTGFRIVIGKKPHDPSKIAHLIEEGHRIVVGGKAARIGKASKKTETGRVVGQVPPHPFLRPAVEANKSQVISAMRSKVQAGLLKEAQKK